MAPAKAKTRPFHVYLRFQARYVLWKVLSLLVRLAHAVPTLSSSSVTTTSQASPASASTSSPHANRDSDFQVLADGTQDLAALVGIFATDSVERYAVDYSKGFLSTCAATLSLLGLLGWTRALIKLALEVQSCENAGFDTKSIRPILGVSETDRLPSDQQHRIAYLERVEEGDRVKWRTLKNTIHTQDSMAFLAKVTPMAFSKRGSPCLTYQNLTSKSEWIREPLGMAVIGFTTVVCNGATCLAILPFLGSPRRWSWINYQATFGLWASIVVGSLLWLYVYMVEQIPSKHVVWNTPQGRFQAFFQNHREDYFVLLQVRPVLGKTRYAIRAISFLAAMSTIVGYICQYITVRTTTASQSAAWLGTQGALALVRALIWIVDPPFDDLAPMPYPEHTWSLRQLLRDRPPRVEVPFELHLALIANKVLGDYRIRFPQEPYLDLPIWAAEIFKTGLADPRVLTSAKALRDGRLDADRLELLQTTDFWDMPREVFEKWMKGVIHARDDTILQNMFKETSASIRVIRDRNGDIHIMPFISFSLSLRLTNCNMTLHPTFTWEGHEDWLLLFGGTGEQCLIGNVQGAISAREGILLEDCYRAIAPDVAQWPTGGPTDQNSEVTAEWLKENADRTTIVSLLDEEVRAHMTYPFFTKTNELWYYLNELFGWCRWNRISLETIECDHRVDCRCK